jgi:hypothetical protein
MNKHTAVWMWNRARSEIVGVAEECDVTRSTRFGDMLLALGLDVTVLVTPNRVAKDNYAVAAFLREWADKLEEAAVPSEHGMRSIHEQAIILDMQMDREKEAQKDSGQEKLRDAGS